MTYSGSINRIIKLSRECSYGIATFYFIFIFIFLNVVLNIVESMT